MGPMPPPKKTCVIGSLEYPLHVGDDGPAAQSERGIAQATLVAQPPPRTRFATMTSPVAAADSSRRTWERLPTPPSSGRADTVKMDAQSQARTTMVSVDGESAEAAWHQHKRMCRRDPHVLTPPSTRGRRMHDRLGLPAEARSSRHQRHCSDSLDSLWMMGGIELGSMSPSQDEEAPWPGHTWPMFSMPVRDTPHNPFVEGGPADVGFTGPNAANALMRAMARPARSPNKTMFVFRGQRVVCANRDPSQVGRRQPGVAISPPRPHLLFPSRRREARGRAVHALDRHAVSDDEGDAATRRRAGANLFAREMAARAPSRPLPTVPSDAEAAWLASEAPDVPTEWPSQPSKATYELPAKNKELLARLEHVDWGDDDAP